MSNTMSGDPRTGETRQKTLTTADLAASPRPGSPRIEADRLRDAGRDQDRPHDRDQGQDDVVGQGDVVPVLQDEVVREDRAAPARAMPASTAPGSTAPASPAPASREDANLAPLFAEDVASDFRSRWDVVQRGFVDDPKKSVREGDELVAQVIKSLAETFSGQRAALEDDRADQASTENLRLALQRYRSFFERLLSI
jgi:hypothetical protein